MRHTNTIRKAAPWKSSKNLTQRKKNREPMWHPGTVWSFQTRKLAYKCRKNSATTQRQPCYPTIGCSHLSMISSTDYLRRKNTSMIEPAPSAPPHIDCGLQCYWLQPWHLQLSEQKPHSLITQQGGAICKALQYIKKNLISVRWLSK
jgi:hypothetical protein